MPAKNSVKIYSEETYYHIYNRGVEKRIIFQDAQDYGVFLSYLKEYLLSKNELDLRKNLADPNISYRERDRIIKLLRLNNFYEEITLITYCLMPNHFHFLIHQKSADSIDKFMNSFGTRYTMYFNKKYQRVGKLYQGQYKGVMVTTDEQLLHLTRYIHKQALALRGVALVRNTTGQPCSYPEYIGIRKTGWVHPEEILKFFSKTNPQSSYQAFMGKEEDFVFINNLTLEEE